MFVVTNGTIIVGPFDTARQADLFRDRNPFDGFLVRLLTSPAQLDGGNGIGLRAEAERLAFIYRSKVHAIKALREWGHSMGYTPTLHECLEIFRPIWPGETDDR